MQVATACLRPEGWWLNGWYCVLISAAAGNKSATRPPLPPPRGVRRRMERNRQKLVGRDKGSLTEQQTKGTATTTIQIRGIHRTDRSTPQTRSPGQDRRCTLPSSKWVPAALPHPEPSVMSHGMEYRALFGQVGSAPTPRCAPSWSPVKINPVLAKPRTLPTPYSIPSTSCPGPPLSSWSPPLLLSPDIIPVVYGSSL